MSSKKDKKNRKKINPPVPEAPKLIDKLLPIAAFVAVGILIFYPPFFRGLFFKEDMFIYHIITALVFILVWADKFRRKDYSLIQTPLDWAILAYAAAYLISLIGAVHPGEAFYGFLKTIDFFMVFWVVTQTVKNYKDYENILKILLASGVGVAAIGILAAAGLSSYPAAFNGRVILSTMQYPNTTAAFLAVLTIIGVTLWVKEDVTSKKLIYALANFLMILVVLCTLSKGAWLIFAVGLIFLLLGLPGIHKIKSLYVLGATFLAAFITYSKFLPAVKAEQSPETLVYLLWGAGLVVLAQLIWEGLMYLYRNKGTVAFASVFIILCLAGLAGGYMILPQADDEKFTGDILTELTELTDLENNSYTSRYDFARWGTAIIADNPVNGAGAGGWNALYHQYQDYLGFTTEAHNHIIQVGVETGIIGLTAFIAIWVIFIVFAVRLRRYLKAKGSSDDPNRWILIWGTVAAALSLGLHAVMDFDLSLAAIAVLLWTFFALVNKAYIYEGLAGHKAIEQPAMLINVAAALVISLILLVTGISYAAASSHGQKGAMALNAMASAADSTQQNQLFNQALLHYSKATALNSYEADYYADLASLYAQQYQAAKTAQHPAAEEIYKRVIANMEKAEKLKPNDIKIRNSLLNTASGLGDYELTRGQAKGALQANPNDINAYNSYIRVVQAGMKQYLQAGNKAEAAECANELIKIEERFNQQIAKINPDRPWHGARLVLGSEEILTLAKAHFLAGNYNETLKRLEPFTDNLLSLEYADADFEKTEFTDENWIARVVNDSEANHGKCVEITTRKDMHGWPRIIPLANKLPIEANVNYITEVRYKVLECGNSPEGREGPQLGIWSVASGEGKDGLNRSQAFFNGEMDNAGNNAEWKIFKQQSTHPDGYTYRYLHLGTGSVKAGTTLRIDYIKFYPDIRQGIPANLEEAYTWYAASLYKLGEIEKASSIADKLSKENGYKAYQELINNNSGK